MAAKKKRKARTKPEKTIQKEILAWLKGAGYLHWRQNSGNIFMPGRMIRLGYAGLPDIVVVLAPHGRILGLEVKSAVGKMRPAQVEFAAQLLKAGGEYAVVRSVGEAETAVKTASMYGNLQFLREYK
jgi:hypothetical protein